MNLSSRSPDLQGSFGCGSVSCHLPQHLFNGKYSSYFAVELSSKCVILWVGTVQSDRVARAVVQKIVARVERLLEGIRKLGYQGRHRKRMAHSWDELTGLEVVDKRICCRRRRARAHAGQGLPNEGVEKEIEVVKERIQ